MPASFDGNTMFGQAVNVVHLPNEAEFQTNAFFGEDGRVTLSAGTRGRTFHVSGVLVAPDIATLNDMEALIDSYNDGRAYQLVDTRGRTWPSVQYRGGFKPDVKGIGYSDGNVTLHYELLLHGLI